jgi:biopolymer transport protein ExbD
VPAGIRGRGDAARTLAWESDMSMQLGKKGVKSDINITPYIDILLVLLIIFMVAAPLKQHEHEAKVPKPAPPVQQNVKPDMVILDVDKDRTVRLNQKPVPMDQLAATLQDLFSRRANKNLFIRGNSDLPYGDVFKVLDIAKNSGVGDIALLSNVGDGSSAPPAPPTKGAP